MPSIPINTYITAGENTQMVEGTLSLEQDGRHVILKVERIGFMDHLFCLSVTQGSVFADAIINVCEQVIALRAAERMQ